MAHELVGEPEAAMAEIDSHLGVIDEIAADYPNAWDAGEDFLADVRKKLRDVRKTIQQREDVTEGQARAIENWGRGVRRWHPDERERDD